jgi:hypothetical protein
MNKNVFRRRETLISLRLRTCQAIIANLGLWGCESWALKENDRRKVEVFHHRCLRRMLNLTTHQANEKRTADQEVRRQQAGRSRTMHQMLEIQRCRWLQKLSEMDDKRGPRKTLAAWCPAARPDGRPQQTIRHGHAKTLKTLGFGSTRLEDWMTLAKDEKQWAERIEWKLELAPGGHEPKRKQSTTPPNSQCMHRLMSQQVERPKTSKHTHTQSELPQLQSSGTRRVLWISCFDQTGRDPMHRLIEGSPKKLARGSPLIEALIRALIEASID